MDKRNSHMKFVAMSKQDKRLERKKRKAVALLDLITSRKIESETQEKTENVRMKNCRGKKISSNPDTTDATTAKKSKMAETSPDGSVSNQDTKDNKLSYKEKRRRKQKERLSEIQKQIRIQQKQESLERPKLYLSLTNLVPKNNCQKSEELPPLFMVDLQHLLTLALLPDSYNFYPRWCKLLRPGKVSSVVVIVLNQVTSADLELHEECFPFLKEKFDMFVELISPSQYSSTVAEDIFQVPLSNTSLKKQARKAKIDDKRKQPSIMGSIKESPMSGPRFSRTSLLLSPYEMMKEGYPMPIRTLQDMYQDFKFSFDSYKRATNNSPMFAIDCEMCLTTALVNELTRVSVVNEKLETVYDILVKPHNKIINYLTPYSGITKQMLDPVTTRLEDVQEKLRQILPPGSIWVGQSLNSDLTALKLFHPFVIDTSVIYNMSGIRWHKASLKSLAGHFLGREIQTGEEGHSPVEDAEATMQLVQLKLQKGKHFGDATLSPLMSEDSAVNGQMEPVTDAVVENTSDKDAKPNQPPSPDPASTADQAATENKRRPFFHMDKSRAHESFFKIMSKEKKMAVIVDKEKELGPVKEEESGVQFVNTTSDKERVKTARTAVKTSDFVWTQMHALAKMASSISEKSALESGVIKKCLSQLDSRVKKVCTEVTASSLLCVVLTGQTDAEHTLNGGVFVGIT